MPPPGRFDFYWKRISRWCLLGTVVMFLWLMAPVVSCSWTAFRETPISEMQPSDATPADADSQRVEEAQGFWAKFTRATKQCYAKTPLLGQEGWKTQLLLWLAGATLVTSLLARYDERRRKNFT